MEYQEFKSAVLHAAKKAGLEDYELYYKNSSEMAVSVYREEVNQFTTATGGGACFRCIVDGKMGYAATECFDEEQAVSLVERAMDNAASIETEDEVLIHQAGDLYQSVSRTPSEIPGADVMAAVAMDCQKRLYAEDTRVIDGTQSRTIAEKGIVCLANSKGLDLSQEYGISLVSAVSIVQEPGEEEKYMGYKNSLGEIGRASCRDRVCMFV